MGSLEEERLVQMVQDFFELEAPPTPTCICSSSQAVSLHQHTCLILERILESATDAEMEVLDKALKYVRQTEDERKKSSVKRSLIMKMRMDGYNASLCRSSWTSTWECPGGNYEYIDILMAKENGGSIRLIVDIDFRSQFELARPTSAYSQLSSTLPSIYVGSEEKLKKIISLLCSAACQSLRERGLHIPPWRTSSYMQSKWLSCCHNAFATPFPNFNAKSLKQRVRHGSSQMEGSNGPKGHRESALSSQFSDLSINCW